MDFKREITEKWLSNSGLEVIVGNRVTPLFIPGALESNIYLINT